MNNHKNYIQSRQKIPNKKVVSTTKYVEMEEIPDEIKQKYFNKPPYYNFLYAEDELGFNFSEFAKNQFHDFLKSIYVVDLINFRKYYIQRNYIQVRFLAHKFKSPFG